MRHKPLLAVFIGLLAAGCAGSGRMSANECQLSDWRAVGYEDGVQGQSAEKFGRYRRSCAEHGFAADFQAYQSGRTAGLREYCQASRGFQEGSRGAAYHGVCPADVEPRFLDAYNDGHTLYEIESSLNETERRLRHDEARIRDIELALPGRIAAVAEAPTIEERARLIVEARQAAEERVVLEREIPGLQAQQARLEKELADARAELTAKR
jgi:hypothetical protein